MKKECLSFIIYFGAFVSTQAQLNLVQNGSFEEGANDQTPRCNEYYSHGEIEEARQFDLDLLYWARAKRVVNCIDKCPSPDWEDYDCTSPNPEEPGPSDRYVGIAWRIRSREVEGVRVELKETLIPGEEYAIRYKLAPAQDSGHLRVHVTKFGTHWNANPNNGSNQKLNDIANLDSDGLNLLFKKWYSYEKHFRVPLTAGENECDGDCDELRNLILTMEEGWFWVDDVELYVGGCSNPLLIENRKYNFKEAPYRAKFIRAGFDVGSPTTNGPVIVQSNADITYRAEKFIDIEPGFNVEPGGIFLAHIAPCEGGCFQPTANAGDDISLCSSTPLQIGDFAPPSTNFGATYEWTSIPTNAVNYLNSTSISDPIFTPPQNSGGVIKYTLTVTNACGKAVSDEMLLTYETGVIDNDPFINVNNINLQTDFVSFDVDVEPASEKVEIQIKSTQTNQIVKTYTLYNGHDYTCCSFNWTIPDYLSNCSDYIVFVFPYNRCTGKGLGREFRWDRNRTVTIHEFPNVFSPDGDGVHDELCLRVSGAESYGITVRDRDDNAIYQQTGSIKIKNGTDVICLWQGQCNGPWPGCTKDYADGDTYSVIVEFYNCINSADDAKSVLLTGVGKKEAFTEQNKEERKTSDFFIYPNPTDGTFKVKFELEKDEIVQLDMYNISGQIIRPIFKGKMNRGLNQIEIDTDDIPAGVYYMRTSWTNFNKIKKVVIM